jgi:hypothetical protein
MTVETRRCGRCGNEIPDWSGGICPVCERLSQGEKRFWKGGKKRPRRRPHPQPTRPPSGRVKWPKAKPVAAIRRRETQVTRRPLGQCTQARRRLDGFNRLLQEIYGRPVWFSHLLTKQAIPSSRIERWRRDGIWLVHFLKRLELKLRVMLTEAEPDQDPKILSLWYGLDGRGARPLETIVADLNMTMAEVLAACQIQLRYLQREDGRAAFEKVVLTAATETKESHKQKD